MVGKQIFFAFCLHTGFVFAVTSTWIAPSTEDWDKAANWNPATVPTGPNNVANFTDTAPPIPALPVVRIATAPTVIGTINLDAAPANQYTLAQMGAGTLEFNVSSASAVIRVTNTLGNGAHTFSVPISLASPLRVTQGSSGNLTLSGSISGIGSLTKEGTGTLVLSSINTYASGTFIDVGKLSINGDDRLGLPATTGVTISNGILEFTTSPTSVRPFSLTGLASINVTGANLVVLNGVLSGGGSLTKADTGTLRLTNTNTYTGGTIIGGGTLNISSDANLGAPSSSLTIGNGTLDISGGIAINRAVDITGNASINSAGINTFNGNITGGGSVTFLGGGTFVLVGSNSYSGGTVVNAFTQLSGTTNGVQGNIALNFPTSLLTFSQNFNGIYSGALSGSGLVSKLGSGTTTFTGASPAFTGNISILQGALIVNSSLANSTFVTVFASGTLGGSGIVGPTTSFGTINPGNGTTVGNLTVNGMLNMMAGANTIINVAPLISDRITAVGAASITGPLQIDPVPGFYGFSARYTILNSAALAGTFAPISSTNPAFIPTVSYTATDTILDLMITEPFAAFPFSNENTKAVGNNIDALNVAGKLSLDLMNVFNSFIGQNIATINAALDEMHPAPYSAFTEMQAEIDAQLLSLFHRLPYLPCSCNNPNRLWIEGIGNSLTMKPNGIQIGFQANSGGIALGYDGQISNQSVVGIGGAWTYSNLDWAHDRGHGDVNGAFGGLYFDSQAGSFYYGATLLAGMNFYNTSRHMKFVTTNRKATADFKALDIMAQFSTAYLFGSPQAFFYPYATFDYLYLHTKKFREQGAEGLNLNVFPRTDGTLRTEMGLGLQVQDSNAAETVCISPLVSIGWVNMSPIERPKLETTFAGASIRYKVLGWDQSWNFLNLNFGLSIAYRCFSVMLDYNVEFSPDKNTTFYNQNGHLRLDWKW